MKIRAFILGLLILGVAGLAALPGDVARADDKARQGVWVYDVRVVRVDPATAEGVETAALLGQADGTTTRTGWPEILGLLKKRGKTTIFVDQRVTALDGEKATITTHCETPGLPVNFADINNTQKRSSIHTTGCKFEVVVSDGKDMRYQVEAKWSLPRHPIKASEAPPQLTTAWNGTHPALAGETLVLHYREQIDAFGLTAVKPVEVYALITGRFIAR